MTGVPAAAPTDAAAGDCLIEIRALGNALRVSALDAASGLEVVFIAPRHASPDRIARIARDKLAAARRRAAAG